MRRIKKGASLLLAMVMLLSVAGCGGKESSADEKYSYELWLSAGEEATYYTEYNENPALKYLNTLQFKGEDGELHDVHLQVYTGVTGSAKEQFNTMISTEEYYDVMDIGQSSYSALELYEQGYILDLTPYIEAGAMPNYVKYLEANPDYAKTATTLVNGEPKYLQVYAYHEEVTGWGGWQYRRDWIVKYGKDPVSGAAFTGQKDEDGNWSDDIKFPSWYNDALRESYLKIDPNWDGSDPIFISDWEWMLNIFATAIEDCRTQGLIAGGDGYPMSLYYPGYNETGILLSGFGGGSAVWYKDGDTVRFGGTSDTFKTYLECMRSWYSKGWIDTAFNERTGDMFYKIDSPNMYSGNVGLFYSNEDTTLDKLDKMDSANTSGIYVLAAREPINDVYGDGDCKYVPGANEFVPDSFYQTTKEQSATVFTNKLDGKDVWGILSVYDYLFEPDTGARLTNMGLTAEQYATIAEDGDCFHYLGIEKMGSYYVKADKGEENTNGYACKTTELIGSDANKRNPCTLNRMGGLQTDQLDWQDEAYRRIHAEWDFYTASAQFLSSFTSQMSSEDSKTYYTALTKIRTQSNVDVPKFIKGEYDLAGDWDTFCKQINRLGVNSVTEIFQELMDQFQ